MFISGHARLWLVTFVCIMLWCSCFWKYVRCKLWPQMCKDVIFYQKWMASLVLIFKVSPVHYEKEYSEEYKAAVKDPNTRMAGFQWTMVRKAAKVRWQDLVNHLNSQTGRQRVRESKDVNGKYTLAHLEAWHPLITDSCVCIWYRLRSFADFNCHIHQKQR